MTNPWLWFSLAGISLLLFLYPYVFYPLVLRLLAKYPYQPEKYVDTSKIKAALLFCAYNEEASLPEKIANLRQLKNKWPDLQILAYSDCSDDDTNALLEAASDILTPVIGTQRTGKVIGMRKLVSMTDADVLIFMDANVILEPDSLPRLLAYFTDPEIGCVAGTLLYISTDDTEETPTAKVGGLYWKLEEHIKRLESETGSTMGADGAIFARRRPGYPELPGHLVDDMAASISVLFDGKRCVSAPDVIAYERSVGVSTEEFQRKRRIACGSVSTYWHLLPHIKKLPLIDRFKFFSHKTLRWWGAFFLLAALLFAFFGSWSIGHPYIGLAFIVVITGGIWLLGSLGVPLAVTVYEIIRAVIATALGLVEAYRGRSYQTWTPAKSR